MRVALLLAFLASIASADDRPGLFFREDWAESPPAIPVNQEHVTGKSLVLGLHGPGGSVVKKSHHDRPADDPFYLWSGLCPGNWAVSLSRQDSAVDLTGLAKVRWRAKQAGFRHLRLVLKLADGSWLVSEETDGPSSDWRIHDFHIPDVRWRSLDIKTVVEGPWVDNPDLSRVQAVGFTDLMAGGQSRACSRLDWIEVYGRRVER